MYIKRNAIIGFKTKDVAGVFPFTVWNGEEYIDYACDQNFNFSLYCVVCLTVDVLWTTNTCSILPYDRESTIKHILPKQTG